MCRSDDVLDEVLALSADGHEDESFFQADPSPQIIGLMPQRLPHR